jgi:hypothetical protein
MLCMFISILYMFRATMWPSSGEITVSIRHLVFVTLCVWPPGRQGGFKLVSSQPAYQTVIHTHSDKYQVSYWYSYFSWWWAHSCPKHVENRNKHTKKGIVYQVGFIYKIIQGCTVKKQKKIIIPISLYVLCTVHYIIIIIYIYIYTYIYYTCFINDNILSTTVSVLGRQKLSEINPLQLEVIL